MALKNTDPPTVILDLDTVNPTDGDLESYLLGLLDLPAFRLLRYRDQGPPVAEQQTHEHFGAYADGWLLVTELDDAGYDLVASATHTTEKKRITKSTVWGGDLLNVPLHYATARLENPTEEQTRQVRRDLILRRAGEAVGALVIVTNRKVLLDTIPELEGLRYDCTTLTPAAALSFAGYWLRARGEYVVHAGSSTGRTDRSLFYTVATHVVLPAAWRWGQALATANAPDRLTRLHLAQRSRFATALKARDRSWAAGFTMSASDARDEGIDCVIDVALNLMGAFDSIARLIEALNPTGTDDVNAVWQKPAWIKLQKGRLPDLINTARRHKPIFDIVRSLRNTIHGTALHTVLVKDTYSTTGDAYLALPVEDTEALRSAFNNSGGFDTWRVKELYPGHLQADPDRLIDEMITRSAASLNEMMQAVPIESLLGLPKPAASAPPNQGVYHSNHLKNIERQLGLELTHTPGDHHHAA